MLLALPTAAALAAWTATPLPQQLAPRSFSRRCAPPTHIITSGMAVAPRIGAHSPLTIALQLLHACAAVGGIAAPEQMDQLTATLWTTFTAFPVTHNPMFEAHVAVFAFVVWVLFYESLHLLVPNAARFRLDGKPPLRPLHNFGPELHKSLVPAVAYLASIAVWCQLGLRSLLFDSVLGPAPAVFEAPTFGQLTGEVALGVFLYDLLFYPIHYSFHSSHFASWRRLHSRHHRWGATERVAHNAVETIQNSYLDAGIQVFINICVQQFSPWGHKHPLSRALHNMMVTYLLTEAHSGYDLPFMSHRLFPAVFTGPIRHEVHHRTGRVYYHQFFRYLDDAFGFVLDNVEAAHGNPSAQKARTEPHE